MNYLCNQLFLINLICSVPRNRRNYERSRFTKHRHQLDLFIKIKKNDKKMLRIDKNTTFQVFEEKIIRNDIYIQIVRYIMAFLLFLILIQIVQFFYHYCK